MANRLADAQSSYLRQHADNPVDWWPWGDAALTSARERDVPILLSVGYASCHWCHVMAHESFSDPTVAAEINAAFVPVKVDREERPDVDAVYMTATQALTGQGGWPMTCFLTPDGRPFYAGTYFPPRPRPGMPSFRQVLAAITEAWAERRSELLDSAERITTAISAGMVVPTPVPVVVADGPTVTAERLDAAVEAVLGQWDAAAGGFRGAPKFPPAAILEFLLRAHERTGRPEPLDAVSLTLDRMGRGGIFDQLAGGFARYSVDAVWHVPHFEKMLDDNAQLLRVYAHHARLTGSPFSLRIAEQTAEFLLTDLSLPDGSFAASLDADTEGVEGLTYVWTPGQLAEVLGPDDGVAAAGLFGVSDDRPPELAGSVLRLPAEPVDPEQYRGLRDQLRRARGQRPQPSRDDLVVLRTNALAAGALAEAGAALSHPEWVEAAERCLAYLMSVHRDNAGWLRSSAAGRAGEGRAQLADVAELAATLLAVHQATGRAELLDDAAGVLNDADRGYADADGWWDAPHGSGSELFLRPRDPTDGAAPGGASTMAGALVTAAALTGWPEVRSQGYRILAGATELMTRHPRAAGWYLAVAEAVVAGPLQVAVSGPDGNGLLAAARRLAPGGSVVVGGPADAPGVVLLADRPEIQGRPAAYVCRGFVCDRPVTVAEELAGLLRPEPVGRG